MQEGIKFAKWIFVYEMGISCARKFSVIPHWLVSTQAMEKLLAYIFMNHPAFGVNFAYCLFTHFLIKYIK